MRETIAFIGGGQMAGSLIGGLIAGGYPAASIRVAEPDAARADALRREFGVSVAPRAGDIADGAGALVLAVKPQVMQAAVSGLRPGADVTVISIAAGIRIAGLRRWLGHEAAIVRSMPNTPALLRSGISGAWAPASTREQARTLAETILRSVGEVCWVEDEAQLDAVTALSGSGPAYFFLLVEAMREAGTALGLAPETASRLARQTFIGAARMAEQGGRDVSELRAQVTSKGGTTEAALRHLETAGLRRLVGEALAAAERRARELGDEYSGPSANAPRSP
jgi:pyrroline-5-carboxylate reductase